MRTTKMRRDVLKRWLANEDYEPSQDDVAELLLDLDEQLENVAAIALAAGLGADATAEEVAARVGELREAERLLVAEVRAHAFADSFSEADRLRPTMEAFEAHIAGQRATVARLLLSRRLAEESGRG